MYRHLIASALACFGSTLLAQTNTNPATQPQGVLNNRPDSLQSGFQNSQNTLNKNVPPSSETTVTGNGQNRSSLNPQDQVKGSSANSGIPNTSNNGTDINSRSNIDQQAELSGSIQSPQTKSAQGAQRVGDNAGQQSKVWRGDNYPSNGNQGSQSPQRQGQGMQQDQLQYQRTNVENVQYEDGMRGQPRHTTGSLQEQNLRQSQQAQQTQNTGAVYMLRFDANGREYICVSGRPIYFDNVSSLSNQDNSGTQNQYRSGYGSYDQREGKQTKENGGRTTPSNSGKNPDDQNDASGNQKDRDRKSDEDNRSNRPNENDSSVDRSEPKA